ncbi:MAG: T9SS type A sorting domain-containing protein [Chitinophagaceae bacterium]
MKPLRLILLTVLIFICGKNFAQSPGGVTGSAVWLRADVGVTKGTTVGAGDPFIWKDQSGNGLDVNSVISAGANGNTTTPAYNTSTGLLNFNPTIGFGVSTASSTKSQMLTFASTSTGPLVANSTVFVAGAPLNIGTSQSVCWVDATNNIFALQSRGSVVGNYGSTQTNTTLPWPSTTGSIATAQYTSTTSAVATALNSTTQALTKVGSASYRYYAVGGGLAAGSSATLAFGNMAETIIFPSATLTATQMTQVYSYLALKYGYTLNSGATTYLASNGTTNMWTADATFKYNVFGIGTDNTSALKQQVSTDNNSSVGGTTTGILTMSTTNDFTTANNLRSNPLTNMNFVTISDDGGSVIGTSTLKKPASAVSVLQRNWKMQSTAGGGTPVYLQFNTKSTASPFAAATTYALVYTTNSTADYTSNSNIVTLTNTSAGLWTTTSPVTMPTNAIFTIAIMALPPSPGAAVPQVWLRADAGITLAASSGPWVDQLYGYSFGIANPGTGGPNGITTAVNFNPALQFNGGANGANRSLLNTTIPLAQLGYNSGANAQFFVYKSAGTAGSVADYNYGSNPGNQWSVGYTPNNGGFYFGNNASSFSPINNTAGAVYITDYTTNGTTATKAANGVTSSATAGVSGFSSSNFYIGSAYGGTVSYTATSDAICELIVYNADQAVNRPYIESYLATKYGISLPIDYVSPNAGTYYATTTTNSSYANDITVIGKESAQVLDQEQSYSQSAAVPVYIGAGSTIGTSNPAHASSLSNNAYLAFGNNGAGITFTNSNNPINTSYSAMARVWKVQQTGTVGQVMIAIPVSAFTAFTAGGACVSMLTSASSNLSTATVISMNSFQTINGTPCVTFLKDFSDGQIYFSFAQYNTIPAYAATGTSTTITSGNVCSSADSWIVYNIGNNKYLGINPAGNSFPVKPTVTISNNNSNAAVYSTTDATALSSNMFTIDNSAGSPSYTNPMTVRVYYNPADNQAALDNGAAVTTNPGGNTKSKWFKFEGNAAAVAAAQQNNGINGAQYLTPVLGTENGVNYAEFSGIYNFSTFGFMAYNTQLQTLLSIKLQDFNGRRQGSNNLLQWTATDTLNFKQFRLQRSASSSSGFSTIANISYNSQNVYNYTDAGVNTGSYYRLGIEDGDGNLNYSNVLYIAASGAVQSVKVAPNPAQSGHTVNVTLNGYAGGATGSLYNSEGVLINKTKFTNGSNTLSTVTLAKGIYHLIITDANGNAQKEKIVIQ